MSVKSLLRAIPMLLLCATLSAAPGANAASPAASPGASITTKHKLSPDAIKAARLKRLKNQVDLTADQEAKAKPIIDKYVDDRQAAKGDHAQLVALKTKFDADINAILTPDQQKEVLMRIADRHGSEQQEQHQSKQAPTASPATAPATPASP